MRSKRVYAAFSLVCLIFGTTFLAIKIGVGAGAPPFLFAGIRFALAGAMLASALLASGKTTMRRMLGLAPRAALLSVFYIMLNFGATFWAEQYIDSATAAQIMAVGPIVSAGLSAVFLKKKLRFAHFAGIAAGFAGVWLVVRASAGGGAGAADLRLTASIVMVVGAVGFAGSQVLYRKLFGEGDDPLAVSALNMAVGGLGLLALSAVFERAAFPAVPAAFLSLAYLVAVGSLLGHSLNLYLVKEAGPLFASSWSYVSPAIATAAGALIAGERIDALSAAGIALTLVGVAVIARAERRHAIG